MYIVTKGEDMLIRYPVPQPGTRLHPLIQVPALPRWLSQWNLVPAPPPQAGLDLSRGCGDMLPLGSIRWFNRCGRWAGEKVWKQQAGGTTEALFSRTGNLRASDADSLLFYFQRGPQKLDENRSGDEASLVASPRGCLKPMPDDT